MATALFRAEKVLEAAKAKLQAIELDKAGLTEKQILKLMDVTLTFGHLWWKTKRKPYREEAVHYFEKGYWPGLGDDITCWSYPQAYSVDKLFRADIATLNDLVGLATKAVTQSPGGLITLGSSEAKLLEDYLYG